jgi:AraC-like DNA-binding protein
VSQRAAPYASLVEVYSHGSYAPFRRAMRLAGTEQAALVRFAQPAGAFPDPPTLDYTLALNERGTGQMRLDIGSGQVAVPFRRGDLVLKPPGVHTRFAVDAPHQKSFVSLPAALVAEIALRAGLPGCQGRAPDFGALHGGPFRSAHAARLMALMWAEPTGCSPQHRMFGDGVVLALLGVLFGLGGRAASTRAARPLSPERLASVAAFVQAHIGESFGVEEMAACVGLSAWHFSRAFKEATGRTPRNFVTQQRLAHARRLLSQGRLPLAQVAQECGFADQAHFTTTFRRHAGIAPGAWRRKAS